MNRYVDSASLPKKRGRPKKQKVNEKEAIRMREIENVRKEYNDIVNKTIYRKSIPLGPIVIKSRAEKPILYINSQNWESDTEAIRRLLKKHD